jgi:hypothetical protein
LPLSANFSSWQIPRSNELVCATAFSLRSRYARSDSACYCLHLLRRMLSSGQTSVTCCQNMHVRSSAWGTLQVASRMNVSPERYSAYNTCCPASPKNRLSSWAAGSAQATVNAKQLLDCHNLYLISGLDHDRCVLLISLQAVFSWSILTGRSTSRKTSKQL